MKDLILICDKYPYDVFLENELPYLNKYFKNVYIFSDENKKIHNYKTIPNQRRKLKSLFSLFKIKYFRLIKNEIKKYYQQKKNRKIISIIYYIIIYLLRSMNFYINFKNALMAQNINIENCIVYHYWMNHTCLSTILYKNKYKKKYLILTRVHGYDLYFEVNKYNYIPFRNIIYDEIDYISFISNKGMNYFIEKNNIKTSYNSKLIINYLGVKKGELFLDSKTKKNYFTIVSCSSIIKVKRIDLIIKTLASINDKNISWYHIGDGLEKERILDFAKRHLDNKSNITYSFLGKLSNTEVLELYRNINIDLFINLSDSEGIPQAIMEAFSYGIPVIACNVGGVSEIVDNNINGILLPYKPEINLIREAIEKFIKMDLEIFKNYKINAYDKWESTFNSDNNYKKFVKFLISLK